MTVRAILDLKGRDVVTIAPEKTLADAAGLLSENRIGALVVVVGERVSGILSERDIVRLNAASRPLGEDAVQPVSNKRAGR